MLRRVQRLATPDAGASETQGNGFTRGELIETARELGYSEAQATTALAQYEVDQRLLTAEHEIHQLGYRRLTGHFIAFASLNGLLFLTGVWTGTPLWLALPMVLWTTWLLLHLRGVLFPNPDDLRRRAQKRMLAKQLQQSSREFGDSVSAGAAKLLALSARKIDEKLEKIDGQ